MERETRELEIAWNGKPTTITVQELLEGENQDIQREAMNITFVGQTPRVTFDAQKQRMLTVIKGIAKAPFKPDLDTYRGMKIKDATLVFDAVLELSGLAVEKKENLAPPSSVVEHTG